MAGQAWGMTQTERMLPALDPASAPLDERSQAELIAFAPGFAKLINYVDFQGNTDKDWSHFFETDICYLLAEICSLDQARQNVIVREAIRALENEGRHVGDFITRIFDIASRLDRWYLRASAINATPLIQELFPLSMNLNSIIEQELAPCVTEILSNQEWSAAWERLNSQHPLNSVWVSLQKLRLSERGRDMLLEKKDDTPWYRLIVILNTFNNSCAKLQSLVNKYLQTDLSRRDHPAHSTLYLAFLRLFQIYQNDLNGFTSRHLDYYFQTVLQLFPRAAKADSVYLSLTLSKNAKTYLLPDASMFNAGRASDGSQLQFASVGDASLNQISVAQISTLFLKRSRQTGNVENMFAAPFANSADGLGAVFPNPDTAWPLFGQEDNKLLVQTGLAFSSPLLLLQEGVRCIRLQFDFVDTDAVTLLNAYIQAAAACYQVAPDDAEVLADAFLLYLSTANGWLEVVDFSFLPDADNQSATLSFELSTEVPAIVANGKLPDVPVSGDPMLKLALNPAARLFAYSYLGKIRIKAISIDANVSGLQGCSLQNNTGKLDASKPFSPLGAIPVVGSYLQIQHPEWTQKMPDVIRLQLNWMNLPVVATGFASYYDGYQLPEMNNRAFLVRASVYRRSAWEDIPCIQDAAPNSAGAYYLFAEDANQVLQSSTQFNLSFSGQTIQAGSQPDAVAATAGAATIPDGSVRLTLSAPSYAFAHALYPRLFAETAIRNIKKVWLPGWLKQPVTMLNPPFSPEALSINAAYEASGKVDPDCVYVLNAFGYSKIESHAYTFFPIQAGAGQVFIGLEKAQALQTVSLYFQFRESPASSVVRTRDTDRQTETQHVLHWYYLSGSQWLALPKSSVETDTQGLLCSGIVRLQLPKELVASTTLMPADMIWLAASTSLPDQYSPCISIVPQAVKAVRVLPDANMALPLPIQTIKQLMQPVSEVASVTQLGTSVGGSIAENQSLYRTRVAERLQHKARASQATDYERILLDAFPEVWQAKCIGSNQSARFPLHLQVAPGHLVIVVIPQQNADPFSRARLAEMADYLLCCSS
ncbi:MAG: baseplate J/gp47 family protein, partial [Burkholderiales bacterium]|nr:baseplate J/gp47 family protein [Burkholderiales bacterium]